MSRQAYRLTESVADFPEGEILDVTARFGDWHMAALELRPRRRTGAASTKLVVTEADAGFSEAEILDPTARFGDWQAYDLAFEPGFDDSRRLTVDQLEEVTVRVEPTA